MEAQAGRGRLAVDGVMVRDLEFARNHSETTIPIASPGVFVGADAAWTSIAYAVRTGACSGCAPGEHPYLAFARSTIAAGQSVDVSNTASGHRRCLAYFALDDAARRVLPEVLEGRGNAVAASALRKQAPAADPRTALVLGRKLNFLSQCTPQPPCEQTPDEDCSKYVSCVEPEGFIKDAPPFVRDVAALLESVGQHRMQSLGAAEAVVARVAELHARAAEAIGMSQADAAGHARSFVERLSASARPGGVCRRAP
jgi:hypothetical protein